MITAEEARALTLKHNNSIAERVDELLENGINNIIKYACEKGENTANYYFDKSISEDPTLRILSMSLIIKLKSSFDYDAKIIYSMRDPYSIIGINISW